MLYKSSYDTECLRGVDDPTTLRPWNLTKILQQISIENKPILLDLGTGTAFKIASLKSFFSTIYGVDISMSMLASAKHKIQEPHIKFIQADNYKLPFKNQSIDVVASFLSRWDPAEIHRVIKKEGDVLIEWIGCEDKRLFKLYFGYDNDGPRGQFLEYELNEFLKNIKNNFSDYFKSVKIINGYWRTYYSIQGILKLLHNTPTIRNFNYKKDKFSLKKAINNFITPQGILLEQNRVLIHAKNPK